MKVQGGPSGRGILFVDIKLKVLPHYELLLLQNATLFSKVTKRLSSTRWATLYTRKKYSFQNVLLSGMLKQNHVNLGPPPVDVRVPPARGLRAARGPPGHHAAPHPHQVPQPPLPGARHRAHHTYGRIG